MRKLDREVISKFSDDLATKENYFADQRRSYGRLSPARIGLFFWSFFPGFGIVILEISDSHVDESFALNRHARVGSPFVEPAPAPAGRRKHDTPHFVGPGDSDMTQHDPHRRRPSEDGNNCSIPLVWAGAAPSRDAVIVGRPRCRRQVTCNPE